jgi:FkbM family methyltransferase
MPQSIDAPFGAQSPGIGLSAVLYFTRQLPPGRIGRRLGRFMRSWLSRAVMGPVDLKVLRQNMRLYPRGNACERTLILTPQHFDRSELEVLSRHLHPRFVFFDVGANVGAYSLFVASHAGPEAKVFAIEPHPVVARRLAFNIGSNNLPGITVLQMALSDKAGEAELHTMPQNLGTTTIRAGEKPKHKPTGFKVRTDTLLSIVTSAGLAKIDAIKLDVEGAEEPILSTFFRDARQTQWPLVVILENRERVVFELLSSLGYRHVMTTRDNVIFERDRPMANDHVADGTGNGAPAAH